MRGDPKGEVMADAKVQEVEINIADNSFQPKCGCCKAELTRLVVVVFEVKSFSDVERAMYCCPTCHAPLGFGQCMYS